MTRSIPPISVRLPPDLCEALDVFCAQTGKTRSNVVQEGIAQYLTSQSGPTLSSLAEAILQPEPPTKTPSRPPRNRQQQYREYVREKRRR